MEKYVGIWGRFDFDSAAEIPLLERAVKKTSTGFVGKCHSDGNGFAQNSEGYYSFIYRKTDEIIYKKTGEEWISTSICQYWQNEGKIFTITPTPEELENLNLIEHSKIYLNKSREIHFYDFTVEGRKFEILPSHYGNLLHRRYDKRYDENLGGV